MQVNVTVILVYFEPTAFAQISLYDREIIITAIKCEI
jgi:hypothetical protein